MSFVAIIYAKEGKTLLGGVRIHRSSRFGNRSDAEAFRDGTVDINKEYVESSEIVTRNKVPELFRHCAGAELQALNGRCEACGKILTVKDSIEFARFHRQWAAQGREYRGREKES